MSPQYQSWISEHYPDASGYGKCHEATEELVAAFPELRRVRGFYLCGVWGQREHWWCVAPDGSIVDPTAGQFPSKGFGVYSELDPDEPEPTGKCLDCGEYVYDGNTFCDTTCEARTRAYMGI
jgi:hypothetical protein